MKHTVKLAILSPVFCAYARSATLLALANKGITCSRMINRSMSDKGISVIVLLLVTVFREQLINVSRVLLLKTLTMLAPHVGTLDQLGYSIT